ncbi:50S ribosomal protein L21 [Candidatus Nomurabacteria bacterium]|uniref:Large ribosomal subunit protein bL21 n=1 Tax=candidate division WWE3 bacterium TaxID=2053526 RepID=A0A955E2T9_UNCKA|nr:50S ribosomal protein L21 [candidate division WWE3 bacterium]MCB9824087.1 50S ribosomal protein L21 [Candidatus Nomurabacteria bacterium]MCB9826942.1 50S ribosomal protein L21 [Candidatus Nomurabacteria bacterium]MCB9828028.1 50S ribosomal protein L21 [Candidatus Nomurabacteria bacterium]HXK52536.1 50S ribosomal protein L21 [bacterium]
MKYAVIQLGGKQLRVQEGDVFEIERQNEINLEVLMYSEEGILLLDAESLKGVTVKTTILEQKRDDKIRVARFKSKSRYRKVKGHKQPISVVKIDSISVGKKSTEETKTKAENQIKPVSKVAKSTIEAGVKKSAEKEAKAPAKVAVKKVEKKSTPATKKAENKKAPTTTKKTVKKTTKESTKPKKN